MTIEQLLQQVSEIDPAASSVESSGLWWSWSDVHRVVAGMTDALTQASVPAGGRVGLLLRNRAPHLASLISCVIGHRCAVAFNPVSPPARLADDILAQSPAFLAGAREDFASADVRGVIETLNVPALVLPAEPGGGVEWLTDTRRIPVGAAERLALDTMVEMLSSGTTGTPKRIPLTRNSFNLSFQSAQAYEKNRGGDGPVLRSGVRLQTAPLTHISGLFTGLMTFAEGRKLVLLEKFSVESWTKAVERTKPRIGNLPPAALRMILDANVPKEQLESLIALRSGTAPLDPVVIDAFLERYGLPVLVQYGATEFAGSVAGWEIKAFKELYNSKRGSVGRIQPNLEARVIDEASGMPLPFGEQGILELRGKQLGSEEKWIRTTDRASLDADNYLWIHGRADNAINRGGFKIHPDDVVRAIEQHPSVREAVVVGIPDQRLGEVPAAAIILLADETAPTVEELRAFLATLLLPYQIPAQFRFVEDVPRTPSLKPSLVEVRRLLTPSEAPA